MAMVSKYEYCDSDADFMANSDIPFLGDRAIATLTSLPSSLKYQTDRAVFQTQFCPFLIDDSLTRRKLWRTFFPDTDMPITEIGAVTKYHGVLDQFLKTKPHEDSLDKILRKVKGKGASFE
jgi:hypothetical protein